MVDNERARAFREFHRENPHVYELFKRFAFEVIRAGRPRYSARTIFHRIRWHTDIETKSDDGFKICDHHSPYYARLFAEDYPKYKHIFSYKHVEGEASTPVEEEQWTSNTRSGAQEVKDWPQPKEVESE